MRALLILLLLAVSLTAPQAASPPTVAILPQTAIITIDATGLDIITGTITQAVTFANPVGNAWPKQIIRIEVESAKPYAVQWGKQFTPKHGMPLPTKTTGSNVSDMWAFQYNPLTTTWSFLATTQPPPTP